MPPPDYSGIARSLEVSHTINTSLSWDRGGSRQIKQGEHQNKRAAMLSQAETTVFCGDVQCAALYVDTLLSSSAALIYCIFIHKCPCWELFLHAHSLSITFPETQQHLQQRFHCVTAVSLRWPWVWDIYQQGNKTKRLKKKKRQQQFAIICLWRWHDLSLQITGKHFVFAMAVLKLLFLRAPRQVMPLSKLMLPISPVLLCIHHRRFTVRALNNPNPYTGNYEKIHLARHKCFIFVSSALGPLHFFPDIFLISAARLIFGFSK